MKALRYICLILVCQLIFSPYLHAEIIAFTNDDRTSLISNLKNWQTLFTIVRFYIAKSDLDLVVKQVKEAGVSLDSSLGITIKSKVLYCGNEPIKFSEHAINYKGHMIKYDLAISYYQNYQKIYNRISSNSEAGILSLLVSRAHARDKEKSNTAAALGIAAGVLTGIAFCFEAPAWIVPAGVATIFIFAAISIAYETDHDSGMRAFECLPDGWSVTNKDTTVIKTTGNSNGEVIVEKIGRNGIRNPNPATPSQIKLFYINQKACEVKNLDTLKEMRAAIMTVKGRVSPGVVGAPTSK